MEPPQNLTDTEEDTRQPQILFGEYPNWKTEEEIRQEDNARAIEIMSHAHADPLIKEGDRFGDLADDLHQTGQAPNPHGRSESDTTIAWQINDLGNDAQQIQEALYEQAADILETGQDLIEGGTLEEQDRYIMDPTAYTQEQTYEDTSSEDSSQGGCVMM
jgi:hypothetical protein